MIFIITQVVLLLLIFFLLYILSWFLPTDSPWAPWWATSKEKSRALGKIIKPGKKDILYELGSGTGTTVVTLAKEFNAEAVGIESSKSRVIWSKLKAKRVGVSDKTTFLQNDFFTVDLSPATVVYLYLVPRVIQKLKPKLLKDMKPGTRVVSNIYEISYLPLIQKDEKQQLYVYSIPAKK